MLCATPAQAHPGGGIEELAQTPLDDVASSTDAIAVTTNFVRNGFGDMIQEVSPDRGTSVYYYDAAGQVSAAIDGRDQRIDYVRDILGRVLAIRTKANAAATTWTNIATDMAYESFASLKSATLGNALVMNNNWGNDGRLASRGLQTDAGANRSLLAYSYDNDGNITRIADGVNAAKTVSYEYDVRGQLSAAEQLNSGQVIYNRFDYLHDANGNRTALERRYTKGQVEPDTVDNYTLIPGTNRLASITTDALTRNLIYDNRGNLSTETRGPTVTATRDYDGHGRLLSYARTSEDSRAHVYNGLDDRDA